MMEFIKMPDPREKDYVVVLADGNFPSGKVSRAFLHNAEKVVCCDGAGLNYVNLGGIPDAIVGDCDSLPEEFKEKYSHLIHCDSDQESNDQTKAVVYCAKRSYANIIILGATGKREDHTLGNLGLLPEYNKIETIESVRTVTDFGVFDIINEDASFESFPGQQVSLFCIDPDTLVTTGNLLFPLNDANLMSWWQGTLNQSLGNEFTIKTNGNTLVYRLFKN